MFTDAIDKLKREYTDKYVVVDAARPELARFKDVTGRVKTVNMSGRALVEFDDYHLNTGWYDIDPSFLKVVDKPAPKVEKPKAEKKPAAPKAEAKPAAAPAAKTQAAPAAGKMSVAEMMAAARAGKGGGGAAAPAKPAEAKPKAEAAKPTAKPTAKPSGGKMSVAEMMAAARASVGGAAAPEAKSQAEAAPAEETKAVTPVPAAKPPAEAVPADDRAAVHARVDRTKMSVADMLAYCRKVDAR